MPRSMVRATVGVLTYRRPVQLAELLESLTKQAYELSSTTLATVDLLVVDNDPTASAASVVARTARDHPGVRYVLEPTAGISAGRNRALDEAHASDVLAFIDDDELPDTDWLRNLLDTWSSTGAAAVAGRVVETFGSPPDPWVIAGGFFRRRNLPTGTPVLAAGAGNLMLDLKQVRALGIRFNPELGLSGGEDTLFCRELSRRGGRIVWCEEARAFDRIPESRASRRWVLARAFSHGNTAAAVELRLAEGRTGQAAIRVKSLVRGGVRVVAGVGRWLLGLARGSASHQARGLRMACRGAGMVAAATGWRHQEYRRRVAPSRANL